VLQRSQLDVKQLGYLMNLRNDLRDEARVRLKLLQMTADMELARG